MATARAIISGALTYHLNRLSPGETLDADLGALALTALNDVVDEIDGAEVLLYQEIRTSGTVTGTSGTLGVTWAGLGSGNDIHSATVSYQTGMDIPLSPITIEQYQAIPQKATAGIPQFYAHDGAATVYFWPAASGQTVTLVTRSPLSSFADLDTVYVMPGGFQSGLSFMLAERLAPSLVGGVPASVSTGARAARNRLAAQTADPAILGGDSPVGNILTGWR